MPASKTFMAQTFLSDLRAQVEGLYPTGVVAECRRVLNDDDPRNCMPSQLFPSEWTHVSCAVQKRRNEFTAGRVSARVALTRLGIPQTALLVGNWREPIFPEGTVGSITHDLGLSICVAAPAAHLRSIGIDLTGSAALAAPLRTLICTELELERFAQARKAPGNDPHKMTFAVKEALYKAIQPLVMRFVDFQEVTINLDTERGTWRPTFRRGDLAEICGNHVGGRVLVTDDFIIASAWFANPDRGRRAPDSFELLRSR